MKINKYIHLLFLATVTMACDDFLELSPESRVVPRDFLDSELEVEQAVTAMYRQFRNVYVQEQWKWAELRSDNTSNDTLSNRENPQDVDEFLLAAGSDLIRTYWQGSYQGVYRSNVLIDAMTSPDPALRFKNTTTRSRVEGEARFFRAFHYFNLVRLYGDVPLITITVGGIGDKPTFANVPREPVENIYETLIIPDLESAADNLPREYGSTDIGRVTKGAALTLLGEVHLTRGDYANAIVAFEEVRGLGYSLNQNYADNFAPETKNGPESIFELQFALDVQQPAGFYRNWIPANSGNDVIPTVNAQGEAGKNQPTIDLIDTYQNGDLREAVSVAYYERQESGGNLIPYINKFNYEFINEGGVAGQDINLPVYRYADVLLMLAEAYNENSFGAIPDASILLLNTIRNRAGLSPYIRGISFNTAEELRRLILEERRLELAFENKRWFDLMRIESRSPGFTRSLLEAHAVKEIEEKGDQLDGNAYFNIRLLLGIPGEEVTAYGYPQNDGWDI
ncbi:RagB/SusD family nutrient uptake outer membrane protein [Fulvivirga sp. M361]|uniref:RagB/SusD family nutrient uptake outer membrane protein n=1 Tax=Fulvivirga sp. M361 TaxID=2594266 RepID=UPI00117A6251|nr:RagB/SusD family nutrient uptake outer membrane protein [Fulvivirga sp. M361]TRX60014.1 RagB/SusD family nutrient uptake outer membrane protein [Fulvivirga sp. M361]